jgi:rod shape-determining protein MreD
LSSFRSSYKEAAALDGPAWWSAALLLGIALLIQLQLPPNFAFRNAHVSFVVIVVVWFALRADLFRASIFGLIAGLAEDVFSTGTGAGWTIATTLTAIFSSMLSRGFFADSIPLVAIIVAVATLVRDGLFWAVMWFQGYPLGFGTFHFHQSLWQALLDALAVAVIMLALRYRDYYYATR